MDTEKSTVQSVLIRNLNYATTPDVVKEAFEKFGEVKDVYLPLDFKTKRPRGFGFVEFINEDAATEAVKAMDNAELDGSVITCCLAQDRRKSPNSMRRAYRPAFGFGRNRFYDDDFSARRGDFYGRQRSRSRSPGGRYARRSFSYERRPSPMREEQHYYPRRMAERSPDRYGRPYDYDRDYRDHRDSRRGYMDRDPRRYGERPYHDDYVRGLHDRRRSPFRGREMRPVGRIPLDPHEARVGRPIR